MCVCTGVGMGGLRGPYTITLHPSELEFSDEVSSGMVILRLSPKGVHNKIPQGHSLHLKD